MKEMKSSTAVTAHIRNLKKCRRCAKMIPPVVAGEPVASKVLLIGKAPGSREGSFGKPFAWSAGKTLFKWFKTIGLDEEEVRNRIYFAAVCRCFPGKEKGHDRVPDAQEIQNCSRWLRAEFSLLKPHLVIPVGKLAIGQLLEFDKLEDVIGKSFSIQFLKTRTDIIPLPHPSGASTWHRREPGRKLLAKALQLMVKHPALQAIINKGSTKNRQ